MVNIFQTYFNIYFTEIVIGILVLSIIIVLVSIFYVLFSAKNNGEIKRIKRIKKLKKIKYTKQFLSGVNGIDLNLNVENTKKTIDKRWPEYRLGPCGNSNFTGGNKNYYQLLTFRMKKKSVYYGY